MPELPEVEIVVRCLNKLVSGRTIINAELKRQRLAPDTSTGAFAGRLKNAGVNFVHRRGKFILFDLDNRRTLLTHLRMSGRYMLLGADTQDPKYAHAIFHLDGDERLVFRDQRHFGLMKIVDTRRLYETRDLAKLAPEPFSEDFSVEYLYTTLRRSKRNIKQVLLDQTKVCGVGNIYASEAMFIAGVNPNIRANRITRAKAALLRDAIREVMNETLALGDSIKVDPENIGGNIYGETPDIGWRVYDREGEPCPGCRASIVRKVHGGRSTYYCRICQR